MEHVGVIYDAALRDAELKCCVDLSREREFVRTSVVHQGLGFYTLALPRLGTFLEEGLASGNLPEYPRNLRTFGKRGMGPNFLSGLFRMVFDIRSGRILDVPSTDAIESIRQLAYMFKKAKSACSDDRERKALRSFVVTDFGIASDIETYPLDKRSYLFALADRVTSRVFAHLDEDVGRRMLLPKHGPGAVAERLLSNERYDLTYWHDRLEVYFPAADFIAPNYEMWLAVCDRVRFVPPEAEAPVRVVTVPKTQKTPRVIAVEPAAVQYCQQAIHERYREALSFDQWTSHVFNWEDQSVNQRRAYEGSVSGKYATLDLSEASDRVSKCLVERLHRCVPQLSGALFACRSLFADVPGIGIIKLKKFASMGSAMCFPVEAFVFWTIATAAIAHSEGLDPCSVDLSKVDITVYGDDIIVPNDKAQAVIEWLEAFGLKVNSSKSFSTGKFRESCGGDYYDGVEVTPTYCRSLELPKRRNGGLVSSWVAFRNHCYRRGLWALAKACDNLLRRTCGVIPHQPENSPGVFLVSFRNWSMQGRWSVSLHRQKQRLWLLIPTWRHDRFTLLGWLMKWFLNAERKQCVEDPRGIDLLRSVRRRVVNTKPVWN